jgi:hemoglobin-like flavoprotein
MVAAHQQELTRLFYDKLFELDPSLREKFQSDVDAMPSKFMRMLAILVSLVNDPPQLEERARKLGQRQLEYGVQPTYFDASETALLWALEKLLGSRFTKVAHSAWYRFHRNISYAATGPNRVGNDNAIGA